jgi:hypothetical protein
MPRPRNPGRAVTERATLDRAKFTDYEFVDLDLPNTGATSVQEGLRKLGYKLLTSEIGARAGYLRRHTTKINSVLLYLILPEINGQGGDR